MVRDVVSGVGIFEIKQKQGIRRCKVGMELANWRRLFPAYLKTIILNQKICKAGDHRLLFSMS